MFLYARTYIDNTNHIRKKNLQTQSLLAIICKKWSKKEGFHAFMAPITLCSSKNDNV